MPSTLGLVVKLEEGNEMNIIESVANFVDSDSGSLALVVLVLTADTVALLEVVLGAERLEVGRGVGTALLDRDDVVDVLGGLTAHEAEVAVPG